MWKRETCGTQFLFWYIVKLYLSLSSQNFLAYLQPHATLAKFNKVLKLLIPRYVRDTP